jgi:hypothetical protein
MSEVEFTLGEWADTVSELFDEEEYYASEIEPLLDAVVKMCFERNIPFHCTTVIKAIKTGCIISGKQQYPMGALGRIPSPLLLVSAAAEGMEPKMLHAFIDDLVKANMFRNSLEELANVTKH